MAKHSWYIRKERQDVISSQHLASWGAVGNDSAERALVRGAIRVHQDLATPGPLAANRRSLGQLY